LFENSVSPYEMIFRSVLWLFVLIFTYDKKATTFLNAAAIHCTIQYACLPHTTFTNDHVSACKFSESGVRVLLLYVVLLD